MVACPSSLYIIAAETFNAYLDVYTGSFREQQLKYMRNIAKTIDCSTGYLVSVDTSNYLAITPYLVVNIKLPPWAIGIIAGGVALVVIVVIIIIVICVKRKRALMGETVN